jgi:tRNA threonylcarbamoyladenosine biosynthesis protein TsaE
MNYIIEIENIGQLGGAIRELIDITGIKKSMDISCLAFYGEMGAGKTTMIKEICKNLNVNDITSSPSFSLINEYQTNRGLKIFHFDFYRIRKKEEIFDLGYEEYFYSGNLCLIEWPEKVESLLPLPYYRIEISTGRKEKRTLKIEQINN